jgi:uncharacterized delta-60 repeat protein
MASALLSPAALAAPGDLDPAFGDLGRAYDVLDFYGPAWSVEAQGDDDAVFAGGDLYVGYWYYDDTWGFAQRLSGDGSVDPVFAAPGIVGTEVRDVAVAADGRITGVGRTINVGSSTTSLTVFRLLPDGALDPAFGTEGIVYLHDLGASSLASSVVLDPDGRIVIAGLRDGELIVLALLSDGTLDASFAEAGLFVGPESGGNWPPRIVRTGTGGYRVTRQGPECQVLALTGTGAVDGSFGSLGWRVIGDLYEAAACTAIASQSDGRLLVAGQVGTEGLVLRMDEDGSPDPSFYGSVAALQAATALEVSDDGSILVAGRSEVDGGSDAVVMRLLTNGSPDTTFGNEGTTVIDLPSGYHGEPVINDIALQGDRLLLAGGNGSHPFVARLMAGDGTVGPGVLGVAPPFEVLAESMDGEAIVTVRRTGGRSGQVSVVLQPESNVLPPDGVATAGEDYSASSQTLTWADGDVADKQAVIQLLPDAPGAAGEDPESFNVHLSQVQGGAGLGTWTQKITIAADGDPAGQFAITSGNAFASEVVGHATVTVSRNYYTEGVVSVTVTPVSGSAIAGEDFVADPLTLTWADGEGGGKNVSIPIVDDSTREGAETFSVQLSTPTGGAIIGTRSEVSGTIVANDTSPQSSKSGGGAVGALSLCLLALAAMLRRLTRRVTGSRRSRDPALASPGGAGGTA